MNESEGIWGEIKFFLVKRDLRGNILSEAEGILLTSREVERLTSEKEPCGVERGERGRNGKVEKRQGRYVR